MRVFYLGTHRPHWLATLRVPLFVSDTTLRCYRALPRATCGWALDSGAFSQQQRTGGWSGGPMPREYAARIRRYGQEIGGLAWASPPSNSLRPSSIPRGRSL